MQPVAFGSKQTDVCSLVKDVVVADAASDERQRFHVHSYKKYKNKDWKKS